MRSAALIAVLALLAAAKAETHADPRDLAKGRLLIAARDLADPNFAETVVLLTGYGPDGAAGLVITRPSRLTIADLFERTESPRGEERVWRGGPVQRTGMLALLRAKRGPEGAQTVLPGIHLLTSRESLETALGTSEGTLKVFLGYAGWGGGQLEHEVELGTWHILNPRPDDIFAPDTSTLWERLARRMERRIARLHRRPERTRFRHTSIDGQTAARMVRGRRR
ncbi:MAG: YqgE/AlgH family protein [Bryobacteraceae bacterium]